MLACAVQFFIPVMSTVQFETLRYRTKANISVPGNMFLAKTIFNLPDGKYTKGDAKHVHFNCCNNLFCLSTAVTISSVFQLL